MITYRKTHTYGDGTKLVEVACLSTDTQPTDGIANGSKCIEMDTGLTYYYDAEGEEWLQFPPASD